VSPTPGSDIRVSQNPSVSISFSTLPQCVSVDHSESQSHSALRASSGAVLRPRISHPLSDHQGTPPPRKVIDDNTTPEESESARIPRRCRVTCRYVSKVNSYHTRSLFLIICCETCSLPSFVAHISFIILRSSASRIPRSQANRPHIGRQYLRRPRSAEYRFRVQLVVGLTGTSPAHH